MAQAGDPTGTGKGGESIWGGKFQDEFHPDNTHDKRGQVSMVGSAFASMSCCALFKWPHALSSGKYRLKHEWVAVLHHLREATAPEQCLYSFWESHRRVGRARSVREATCGGGSSGEEAQQNEAYQPPGDKVCDDTRQSSSRQQHNISHEGWTQAMRLKIMQSILS